jgi:hypothetical protein
MRDLIRLAQPVLRLLGRDDRGAVGVLVAVLITGGVLLGIGALVIDVGQIYQSRAELQNGADAGALAVAKSCASGSCNTTLAQPVTTPNTTVLTRNHLGTDQVAVVTCSQSSCPPSPIIGCPKAPSGGAGYVDVLTSAIKLPPVFARLLRGNSKYPGTDVKACAQAEWGAPSSANTIAFTVSACTWDADTKQGFAPPPPYPPNPASSFDQVIQLHTKTSNTGCPTEPSGADAPGNFGWTDDSGNCNVPISGGSYGGNTGTSVSQDCADVIYNDWLNKTLIFVPVYTIVGGTGTNSTYTLKGFAAFVITGYNLPGAKQHNQGSDWLDKKNDCKGNNVCINGFFTQGLIPSPGTVGGPPMGASIVELSG